MTRRGRLLRRVIVAGAAVGLAGGGVLGWLGVRYSGAVRTLTRGVGDTTFLSADGKPWFRLDEMRHDVPLSAIAADLQHAVVAVEDRRFYLHPGIDPIGVTRAIVRDLRAGGKAEGGSTLTQQLARTLFLSNARTAGRKVKEAAIALTIEVQLTKPQILELYLNRIYLSAGVYGVQAMSESLFRKPASAVTLSEAAMIAGLIRAPATLSPWTNYDASIRRSHVVLAQMRQQGFITAAQEADARAARPVVQAYKRAAEGASGWAKDYLRQQFRNEFGGDHPPDWTVQTTFDRHLQSVGEQAVANGLKRVGRPGLQAAFVAIDPRNGHILAMVGGADYRASTFNRAVRSERQPGSAFKPLVYAAALGHGYSPVSMLTGLSRSSAPGDPEWVPRNASTREVADALTLRDALAESNNAAAALLMQKLTARPVLELANNAGLAGLPDVPSLALGTGEVTPLALTSAYAAFVNGGAWSLPRSVMSVRDAEGSEVYATTITQKVVMSPGVAYQMVSMLRDVVDRGTGVSARALGVAGPVGGKTGTTNDYHDAWFVGFSTAVVAGVWVGFDTPQSIGRDAYGASIALPIWAEFMKKSGLPAAEFPRPDGIEPVALCSLSHERPVDGCPVYTEYFKDGDQVPSDQCHVHQGSLRQQVARVVGGFFKEIGGRLRGIFGR
ncbi:MAG: PBP1A family penicillin-binding protein [Vicinamibacterales bacterium]